VTGTSTQPAVTLDAPDSDAHLELAGLGKPIRGPEALTDDWKRFWHLTFNIARTQWKMRFFGSALGYLWQLMRPLLLFGVLDIFFTQIGHVGKGPGSGPGQPDHFYAAQLLSAIVLFTFFAESTSGAVRSVLDNEVLVRKIQFPRLVIPLAVVLLSLFNLALNLIVVLLFALVSGVHPMVTWVEAPLFILMLAVLSTGVAMLLSSLFIYFRDIQPIWEVVCQVIFYASPTIVSITLVEQHLSHSLVRVYMLNPLAVVLQSFRHAVINHATPGASEVLGSHVLLLAPILFVVAVFVAGFVVFNRTAPFVAENL
jgi:ABC-2 type transport system permease protein